MITADVIDALVASGATVEMLAAAWKADLSAVKPRSSNAERQDRYRARKASQNVTEGVTNVTRNVTSNGSHAPTCSNTLEVSITPSEATLPQNPNQGFQVEPSAKSRSRQKSKIPDDWTPLERHFERAEKQGFTRAFVEKESIKMRNWAHANENRPVARKANWHKAFDCWLDRVLDVREQPKAIVHRPEFGKRINLPSGLTISEDTLRKAASSGSWPAIYGPKPGERGCVLEAVR